MTHAELKKLLADAGVSQRGAARSIDVNERTMRRYIAGAVIPRTVELALLCLYGHSKEGT